MRVLRTLLGFSGSHVPTSSQRKVTVYISGAHSVGKTTLQQALLNNGEFSKFGFKGQQETARMWIKQKGYTQRTFSDPNSFLKLQRELTSKQASREASETSDYGADFKRFLWDRGIVDYIVYTEVYCGREASEALVVDPAVADALSRLKDGEDTLTFVPKPHEDLVAFDGVRPDSKMEEIMKLHNSVITSLDNFGISYIMINSHDLPCRVNTVITEIKRKWPWLCSK